MKVIIIEDEIPAFNRLSKLLESKGFELLDHIQSVKRAIQWFGTNPHPEVVFMDIKLSDGDAFSIFESVEIKSKIVFTTAFDEFALKAFNHKGIAYLLKPVDEGKLDRLLDILSHHESVFISNIPKANTKDYFIVNFGNTVKKIAIADIVCFYSLDNSTFILSKDNRSYAISKSLEKLENDLSPEQFYRINRSTIINKNYINTVINQKVITEGTINNTLNLSISRKRQNSFKKWYK